MSHGLDRHRARHINNPVLLVAPPRKGKHAHAIVVQPIGRGILHSGAGVRIPEGLELMDDHAIRIANMPLLDATPRYDDNDRRVADPTNGLPRGLSGVHPLEGLRQLGILRRYGTMPFFFHRHLSSPAAMRR